MTDKKNGCLFEDTPKAQLLNNACHLAIDALRVAHVDLVGRWPSFLQLTGALGQPRKSKGKAAKKPKPGKLLNVQENAITCELEAPIRYHLSGKQLGDAARVIQMSCHIEAKVPSVDKAGDSLKNADIRFELVGMETALLDIVFEAKVLRDTADIGKAYLGEAGLARFCRKEDPYTLAPIGGLLAYVDHKNLVTYRQAVQKSVVSHDTTVCSKEATLGGVKPADEFCSEHTCEDAIRPPIWMIHLMMHFPTLQVKIET